MTVLQIVISALFGTLSNFAMRKNILTGGTASAFFVLQLSLSMVAIFFLNPVRTGFYAWDSTSAILGIIAGLVLALMMLVLGKALTRGPAGVTFAVLNSACVMPAVLMYLLFGEEWGCHYTIWNALGSILVVGGLFWAGRSADSANNKLQWIYLAVAAFLFHILLMSIMQWRALMFDPLAENSSLIPKQLTYESSQWFMPMLFATASAVHATLFYSKEHRLFTLHEMQWGVIGGLANGTSMFFLLLSTESAQGWERALLFPISSVLTILLCNLWAQQLQGERINWKANALCMSGILVAAISAL